MPISFETYQRVALEDGDEQWELVCGRLRKKPPMTIDHRTVIVELTVLLHGQLHKAQFVVSANHTRLRAGDSYYIPDLVVIPREVQERATAGHTGVIDLFDEPMPLVIEVWSPSTGEYDVSTKLPEYLRRGDAEIWLIHPVERWLRAWRRQPDGSYSETLYTGDAAIEPVALSGVRIALAALFE